MDRQLDPQTGFLGQNNQLGNLTIKPVYVVSKVVQLLLGTRVQSDCRRACCRASDGKYVNKEYDYEINFAGATSVTVETMSSDVILSQSGLNQLSHAATGFAD